MKILLLIFALASHHIVSSQVGGWDPVPLDELNSNHNLESLLAWGVQNLTQQEVAAGNLPETTYRYEQVYSIYSQVVSGMNYQFDVVIANDLYWVLRATFVVYNQPWTNTTELSSYVYDVIQNPGGSEQEEFVIPAEEELVGGYSSVNPSELDTDEELQNALDYGVKAIIDQAVTEHRLPESEYHVLEIHSIYEQVVSGINYRFDVSVENCAGLVARAVFTVYSQVWTETLEATPESLDITKTPEEGLIGGDCPVGSGSEEEAYLVEEEEMNLENEEEGLVGGYTLLDPQEAANDPEIQDLQQFGANYVIDQGIQLQRIPDTTYAVSQVFSVERQVVSGLNYRFDVELKACNGLTARVQYVVYEQEWSGTREVTSYHLDITAAPNGPALAGCPSSCGMSSECEKSGRS